MASSHSRNASATDRRSVNNSGAVSRAASIRAREYDKPFVRDDGSPMPSENQQNGTGADRAFEKLSRRTSDTERRTERVYTTTKERVVRKGNPVKEFASAGNRGEPDKARKNVHSPVARKKPNEGDQGLSPAVLLHDDYADRYFRTMDPFSYVNSTFICAARCPRIGPTSVLRGTDVPPTKTIARDDNAGARSYFA